MTEMLSEPEFENVVFLNKTSMVIPETKVRVIGCTLWSYVNEESSLAVQMSLRDYHVITVESEKGERGLTVKDTVGWFSEEVEFIRKEIEKAKENNEKVIIFTHHAPVINMGGTEPQFFHLKTN